MTVRLADGRIVEQNIYPGETHCKYDHHHHPKMIGDDVKKNENVENNCNDNQNYDSFSLYSIWTETTIATLLALAPNGSRRQKAVILPKVSLISANYLIMTIMMMMMMI